MDNKTERILAIKECQHWCHYISMFLQQEYDNTTLSSQPYKCFQEKSSDLYEFDSGYEMPLADSPL